MVDVAKLLDDRPDTETLMMEIYDFEESLAKVSRCSICLNTTYLLLSRLRGAQNGFQRLDFDGSLQPLFT